MTVVRILVVVLSIAFKALPAFVPAMTEHCDIGMSAATELETEADGDDSGALAEPVLRLAHVEMEQQRATRELGRPDGPPLVVADRPPSV